jgi:RNA polymerase sigma-70 factor (ECF subfamily)
MYRYALARLSNPETAQELVQEAFVAAVQSYKNFQGRSSIKTWLVAILKRKIVDYYRRLGNRQETDDIDSVAQSVDSLFDGTGHWRMMPHPWQINPQDVYEQKEFMDVLYSCLSNMPSRLAEIFMLREFEEMDTQAICEQLDISESNSWVMLYRARMQLRGCMEANWLDVNEKE